MYGEVSGESDCEAIEFYTCIFLKNAIGYIEKRRQCKGIWRAYSLEQLQISQAVRKRRI